MNIECENCIFYQENIMIEDRSYECSCGAGYDMWHDGECDAYSKDGWGEYEGYNIN